MSLLALRATVMDDAQQKKAMCANYLGVRTLSTTGIKMQQTSLIKMRKLQAKFQADDGKHVWLKGGFGDRVIYTMTWVFIMIGVPMCFSFFYDVAKPPSWKTE